MISNSYKLVVVVGKLTKRFECSMLVVALVKRRDYGILIVRIVKIVLLLVNIV